MKKVYPIETKYGVWNTYIWYDKRDKAYLVEIPSFNNAATFGKSLAEAKYMAQDLIELLCTVAFDKGQVVIDDARRVSGRGKTARLSGAVKVLV
ncbi:MAG: type II toxin-antitoxin system HicB family antitoxin [Patescibacteria group bacterium]